MLTVLCPSRGRPDKALECYRTFLDTRHNGESEMFFILDEDETGDYQVPIIRVPRGRPGMTDALNTAARTVWDHEVVGFVGDDHRFRSSGWDQIFIDQLRSQGGGLVYANDLNWPRGEIPTSIFGTGKLWKALGWMALPAAQHLYLDNAWRIIGEGIDALYYFPDLVIEHMHPAFAKASWDEGYTLVNSKEMYEHDREAFVKWISDGARKDIERARHALDR